MNTAGHIGELDLRRLRAGEPRGDSGPAIAEHAGTCAECKARLRALDDEQRRFESVISFDRFAAGVERAARGARPAPRRQPSGRVWALPTLALAAVVALVVTFHQPATPVGRNGTVPVSDRGDRPKGGAGITVVVAGASGQRRAKVDATEELAPGERLRIGYQSGGHRYLVALSIDEHGEVTPLYPESGTSLIIPVAVPSATHFLPDSIELTGSGSELIIVVLSDQPIDVEAARKAARAAYDLAGGHLSLSSLGLPGEQFTRTFRKP